MTETSLVNPAQRRPWRWGPIAERDFMSSLAAVPATAHQSAFLHASLVFDSLAKGSRSVEGFWQRWGVV